MNESKETFVRKHRWILESKNNKFFYFVSKVKFNFKEKKIKIKAIEVFCTDYKDVDFVSWAENDISQEYLVFNTYDEFGSIIYKYEFSKLELISNVATFDYSDSNISARKICIKYEDVNKSFEMK